MRTALSVAKRLLLPATRRDWFSRFLSRLERAPPRSNRLRVLMYHRVDHPDARPGLDPTLLSATPEEFDKQMRFLAEHYRVVPMDAVVDACRGGTPLPPLAVLVTFDDAYRDFAEHAWPVLRRYGLPATLFVPTAYPDHPERTFWWDRLFEAFSATARRDPLETPQGRLPMRTAEQRRAAFRRMKRAVKALPHDEAMALVDRLGALMEVPVRDNCVLGWEELRWLAGEGVTLGAHTRTHPLLSRVDPGRALDEVEGAYGDLDRWIGSVPRAFAYPAGAFNEAAVEVLRRVGVAVALTTAAGIDDLAGADPLRLRRIGVGVATPLGLLRARLLSWRRWPAVC